MSDENREDDDTSMRMLPAPDIKVTVRPDGGLLLSSPTTGAEVQLEGKAAGMWIVLRHHGGMVDEAVGMLAEYWGEDPADVRCDFWAWVHEMFCRGALLIPHSRL